MQNPSDAASVSCCSQFAYRFYLGGQRGSGLRFAKKVKIPMPIGMQNAAVESSFPHSFISDFSMIDSR